MVQQRYTARALLCLYELLRGCSRGGSCSRGAHVGDFVAWYRCGVEDALCVRVRGACRDNGSATQLAMLPSVELAHSDASAEPDWESSPSKEEGRKNDSGSQASPGLYEAIRQREVGLLAQVAMTMSLHSPGPHTRV
jgi:hypothetical protein